jgi:hypothetical protein
MMRFLQVLLIVGISLSFLRLNKPRADQGGNDHQKQDSHPAADARGCEGCG